MILLGQEMKFGLKEDFWVDNLYCGVLAEPPKFTGFMFSHPDLNDELWYCEAAMMHYSHNLDKLPKQLVLFSFFEIHEKLKVVTF